MQIKLNGIPTQVPSQSRFMARYKAHFARIDNRVMSYRKVRWFAPERKYALPPNIGNAQNPLVFGKIPKEYAERERRENAAVQYANGLRNTDMAQYQKRLNSLKFR